MNSIVLQTILGTDKKNLHLKLFREKHTNRLQIFYGASLLECIPDDPDHITYRTAGGRLYNAGLNRQVLSQTFKVDRRTLQSWGKALLLDDKNKAIRILSGARNKKLTPEIIQYYIRESGQIEQKQS